VLDDNDDEEVMSNNNVYIDDLWRRLMSMKVRRCDPHQAGQLKQLHAREFHHHHKS
jgi:hypothetical protein